jgi:DNA-binding transcriptional LysR family regulator
MGLYIFGVVMDLNAIALFVTVTECKSFTAASLKTGVPTSSISRKLAELEASLDVQLLERTTRKLRLTEKGRIFYEKIRPAVNELDSARLNLVDNNVADRGTLRLSVPPGIEESLIIPLLAEFQKKYPGVCLKVLVTGPNLNFIEDGIDIALRIGELKDSNHIAHTLIEYDHVLVASPDYIKMNGTPSNPAELAEHQIICATNWHNDKQWILSKNNKKMIIDINESLSLNHYAAIQLACEKSMGIAELPSVNVIQAIQQGQLIQILADWKLTVYDQEKIKLSIIYTSNRYNSELIKNFKTFSLKYFNKAIITK